MEDGADRQSLRGVGEHAHLGHRAADANGSKRERKRAYAAHFHHQVRAFAAGLFQHPAVPIGLVQIVQTLIQTQRTSALQLLIAAGYAQHPRSPEPRKLKGKDRDTAGSLNQHRRSRLQFASPQRVPRGDRSAGQRGGFLIAEVFRQRDQPGLLEDDVLGQSAVDVSAQRAPGFDRGEHAVEPVLHEDAGHAVSGLPRGYAFAHGRHFARAVGAGNARQLQFWVVDALHQQQIAIVERNRTHRNQHFAGARRGRGPLYKLQRINAKRRNLPSAHRPFYLLPRKRSSFRGTQCRQTLVK